MMQLTDLLRVWWRESFVTGSFLLLAVTMSLGCRKTEEEPVPEWIVQVGTQRVATAVFQADWLRRQSQQDKPVPAADVIGGFVTEWQAYLAAGQMGVLDDTELQSSIRRLVASKVREKLAESLAKPGADAPIEVADIEKSYYAQPQRWQRPPAWNIAWLVASVSPKAEPSRRAALRERLEGYRRDILNSGDPKATFAILCSNHSDDTATRYLRGELGWLQREQLVGRMGESIADQAILLNPTNRMSAVLESPTKMVLLLHLGHRAVQMRPLDEVAPQIRSEISKQREADLKQALSKELNRRVSVTTNSLALSRLKDPAVPNTTPPAPSPMPRP